MAALTQEIARRKTFAIISHPDAGKTTLTEKFLLFGGAIQTAGAVKSNKITKTAASDFMDIERQRGISVATSVMAFEYEDCLINLLDTPGHRDFAEDTYRTLTAVDSVILVIDCVKGVEAQTERLMEVCRMRDTPVIIFINKMDLEGRDAFDLLDELEQTSSVDQGLAPLLAHQPGPHLSRVSTTCLTAPCASSKATSNGSPRTCLQHRRARLIRPWTRWSAMSTPPSSGKTPRWSRGRLRPPRHGRLCPRRGRAGISLVRRSTTSACRRCWTLLSALPPPRARARTTQREVAPTEEKVQRLHLQDSRQHRPAAPRPHRLPPRLQRHLQARRFCTPTHAPRQEAQVLPTPPPSWPLPKRSWTKPTPAMSSGLYDTGNFKIGDTLTEGEDLQFQGIPSFSPEIFKELQNDDPMKSKQLEKGIQQLTDEGVAQLFIMNPGNRKVVGTVGELQFEVIQYRLEHEYGAKASFVPKRFHKACWLTGDEEHSADKFKRLKVSEMAVDKDGNDVYLAPSQFLLGHGARQLPGDHLPHHFGVQDRPSGVNFHAPGPPALLPLSTCRALFRIAMP